MLSFLDKQIYIYRDDENHSTVSGNKLHKLKPNIELAIESSSRGVVSFAGPYSNHLHALAWACNSQNLASIGIVRGELHSTLTPTLRDCRKWGMKLIPFNRKDFRESQDWLNDQSSPVYTHEELPEIFPHLPKELLIIPEGGSNLLAIDSLAQAYSSIFERPELYNITHAVCATGTGATLAGLYKSAPDQVKVIGIQAVAEGEATLNRIRQWLNVDLSNLNVVEGHLGGFAKQPKELLEFIERFESSYNIPLDPVYNGKVLYKLLKMSEQGYFSPTDRVLIINTGGLQGKRGAASN